MPPIYLMVVGVVTTLTLRETVGRDLLLPSDTRQDAGEGRQPLGGSV